MTPPTVLVLPLPPRPRLVMQVDPSRLTAAERQAIERLVLEWQAREYG